MKLSLTIALLLSTIACAQAAMAQEAQPSGPKERGNRFNFAPSVWKTETARIPNTIPAEFHNVRAGSVPKGNSLLGGNDPNFFSKPAPPPQIQQNVTPRMISTPVVAKGTFNPAFGRPAGPAQQIALQPSTAPMIPAVAPQQAMSQPMGQTRQASAPRTVNTAVSGVIKKRPVQRPTGLAAGPAVAAYKPGFGYTAGPSLPALGSSSVSTSTTVSGTIIRRH